MLPEKRSRVWEVLVQALLVELSEKKAVYFEAVLFACGELLHNTEEQHTVYLAKVFVFEGHAPNTCELQDTS